jgi:ABC-type transport system substrate-binding protein
VNGCRAITSLHKESELLADGKTYLDGLQINIRDAQAAMTQLQAGALDAVKAPGPLDVNALKSDPKYVYVPHPNPGTILEMGINLTVAPFSDKRVGQALNFAERDPRGPGT